MATCVPQHLQSGRLTHPPVILRCAATGNQDSRDPSWLDDLPSEATPPPSHIFQFPSQTGPSHREAYLPAALLESGLDTQRPQSGAGQAGVSADAAGCLNLDSVLFNFRSHALSESCGVFFEVFWGVLLLHDCRSIFGCHSLVTVYAVCDISCSSWLLSGSCCRRRRAMFSLPLHLYFCFFQS